MISKIFIDRPVLASVISIVIVLVGLISITILPVEQTPDITPPTVVVTANYPGASAEVIAETVAKPLEEQINGIEDMIYMSSKCSDDGTMSLTVTFEVGTDVDMATVLTQNRVAIAEPVLPEEVKRRGIITKKQSTNITLVLTLYSPDGKYDDLYISNYVSTRIKDVLQRINGVGEITIFGARDYGMRVWLNPEQLKGRELSVNDVIAAIREQNIQVAAGQIGAPPAPKDQSFQYTINARGRLESVGEFEDVIIKVTDRGNYITLGDISSVELGAQSYNTFAELNGQPAIAIGIYQLPGANALKIAEEIKSTMVELSDSFPPGLEYSVPFDPTLFISESIKEVVHTLFVAVLLVILTVFIFLQDLRTTLIPAVTIPVSLIGTFMVMVLFGISINTLSLFGLVLAIGIVVDDSIVVVENTVRLMDEEGLDRKAAATKAMEQITGPVVATTLVLLAVFIPTALAGGITGRLYSQFALTISAATVFSSVNALSLSPALCGILLRPSKQKQNIVFRSFNRFFERTRVGYTQFVGRLVFKISMMMLLFVIFLVMIYLGFLAVPGGFIPDEDQGYFFMNVDLPEGASLNRTRAVMKDINQRINGAEGVSAVLSIGGYSLINGINVTSSGSYFVTLKDWDERQEDHLQIGAIMQGIQAELNQVHQGIAFAFLPPPIMGLGNAGGFEFQLQDTRNMGYLVLEQSADDLVYAGEENRVLSRMNSNLKLSVPQLDLAIDRLKAKNLGISIDEIFSALEAFLGSAYVNDFNLFNKTYKVIIQADERFRNKIEDVLKLEVRTSEGKMVPMKTLAEITPSAGPQTVYSFNLYPCATITGSAGPGFSSGQAIEEMESLAKTKLASGLGYEWSGMSYQEIEAGEKGGLVFGLAFIFAFLFLAGQYESWSMPIAIVLSIPIAILGAIGLIWLRAYENNIYTQIGLVLLIALTCKNAILIVEFAKQLKGEGRTTEQAAVEAADIRFRALLMTGYSFILGVLPLVVASGAGAVSRRVLGTAVVGGMLASMFLGIFFIPVFYVFVMKFRRHKRNGDTGVSKKE